MYYFRDVYSYPVFALVALVFLLTRHYVDGAGAPSSVQWSLLYKTTLMAEEGVLTVRK